MKNKKKEKKGKEACRILTPLNYKQNFQDLLKAS